MTFSWSHDEYLYRIAQVRSNTAMSRSLFSRKDSFFFSLQINSDVLFFVFFRCWVMVRCPTHACAALPSHRNSPSCQKKPSLFSVITHSTHSTTWVRVRARWSMCDVSPGLASACMDAAPLEQRGHSTRLLKCPVLMLRPGAYQYLLNDEDRAMLPWIKRFQKFDLYSKSTEVPNMAELMAYYKEKINKSVVLAACLLVVLSFGVRLSRKQAHALFLSFVFFGMAGTFRTLWNGKALLSQTSAAVASAVPTLCLF